MFNSQNLNWNENLRFEIRSQMDGERVKLPKLHPIIGRMTVIRPFSVELSLSSLLLSLIVNGRSGLN